MNRSIRVLLVDDFSPFRDFLRTELEQMPDFEIVGEASDGIEAVQKIRKLKPDLILLDVGLPNLNGIEVAQEVPNISAHSIILFVSQARDSEIIEYAFLYGASGYVVKSDAAEDLVPAMESVCRGAQYISSSAVREILDDHGCSEESPALNRISVGIARRLAEVAGE